MNSKPMASNLSIFLTLILFVTSFLQHSFSQILTSLLQIAPPPKPFNLCLRLNFGNVLLLLDVLLNIVDLSIENSRDQSI